MSRPVLLSCEAISKAYGSQSLFTGLSFGLCEGDRVGLVGPNGSGKSTYPVSYTIFVKLVYCADV